MSGPTITFSTAATGPGASVRKSVLKKSLPRRPTNPASRKPSVISFHSICQSPRKLWATSDQAETLVSRSRREHLLAGRVVLVARCRPPARAGGPTPRAGARRSGAGGAP